MNVAITGGRDYRDRLRIHSALMPLWRPDLRLFIGDAKGADRLARLWAHANHIAVSVYCADWTRFGTAAGPIRNARVLDQGRPEILIAFPGGHGTANMKAKARDRGIRVVEVT